MNFRAALLAALLVPAAASAATIDAPVSTATAPGAASVELSVPGATGIAIKEYRVKDAALPAAVRGERLVVDTSDLDLVRTINVASSSGKVVVGSKSGAYVYTVVSKTGKAGESKGVVVSTLSLVVERDDVRSLAYVYETATGKAVSGLKVTVSKAGTAIASATTDASGVAVASTPRDGDLLYFVASQENVAFQKIADRSQRATAPKYVVHASLDRPVYLPGEKASFRVMVREPRGTTFDVPAGVEGRVYVSDTSGDPRKKIGTYSVSSAGTFAGTFTVSSSTGEYALEIEVGTLSPANQPTYFGFQVEKSLAQPWRVVVTPAASSFRAGDSFTCTVSASNGTAPLAAQKVHVMAIRFARERVYSPWLSGVAARFAPRNGPASDPLIQHADIVTGSDGTAKVSFPTKRLALEDSDYYVEAQVSGGNDYVVGSTYVPVTRTSFDLRLATDKQVYATTDAIKLKASVLSLDGSPVPGKTVTFYLDPLDEDGRVLPSGSVRSALTDAAGTASIDLAPKAGGLFRVATTVRDGSRSTRAERTFWVFDAKRTSTWKPLFPRVVPDKEVYRPGELATFLVESPVATATALVTISSRGMLLRGSVKIEKGMGVFRAFVTDSMSPNAFATVAIPTSAGTATASREFIVPPSDGLLDVSIEGLGEVGPGEKATLTVKVKDARGKPVRGEVAVAIVRETSFEKADDLARPVLDTFFQPIVRNVDIASPVWSSGDDLSDENPDGKLPPPVELARLGSRRSVHPIADEPYALGVAATLLVKTVVADATGTAKLTVTFPGKPALWRVTARVAATEGLGEAKGHVQVTRFEADEAMKYWSVAGEGLTYLGSEAEMNAYVLQPNGGRWVAFSEVRADDVIFYCGMNDLWAVKISVDRATGFITVLEEH